jgi:hypothetical protein
VPGGARHGLRNEVSRCHSTHGGTERRRKGIKRPRSSLAQAATSSHLLPPTPPVTRPRVGSVGGRGLAFRTCPVDGQHVLAPSHDAKELRNRPRLIRVRQVEDDGAGASRCKRIRRVVELRRRRRPELDRVWRATPYRSSMALLRSILTTSAPRPRKEPGPTSGAATDVEHTGAGQTPDPSQQCLEGAHPCDRLAQQLNEDGARNSRPRRVRTPLQPCLRPPSQSVSLDIRLA